MRASEGREQEVVKGDRDRQAPPTSQALIPAKNLESSVLQRQQPCSPERMVGEQKATRPVSLASIQGRGNGLLRAPLLSPTCYLILRTEERGSRLVGHGLSPSPGLEESQATMRCSVLGLGLCG